MPYTLNTLIFDLGKYYDAGLPMFSGSIVNSAGSVLDATAATPGTPLRLSFASAAVPPATPCAALVIDSSTTGDLVRTGVVGALPPSPGSVNVITVPPALVPAAELMAAAAAVSMAPTVIPGWVRWLGGILTGGTFIPLVAVLPAPTVTVGSGTMSVTVTGTLAARVTYFFVRTASFTVSITVAPAPSNDPLNRERVLQLPMTAASLTSTLVTPGLTGFLASVLRSTLEAQINRTIYSRAAEMLAAMGRRLTPTAVINARRVTVVAPSTSGGGINLQLGASDLFGNAVMPIPSVLNVSISPVPQSNTQTTYTVTVTDAASGNPVTNATVTLNNYDSNDVLLSITFTVDALGRAVFAETLRTKETYIIVSSRGEDGRPDRERELTTLYPTLRTEAPGYNRVVLTLDSLGSV